LSGRILIAENRCAALFVSTAPEKSDPRHMMALRVAALSRAHVPIIAAPAPSSLQKIRLSSYKDRLGSAWRTDPRAATAVERQRRTYAYRAADEGLCAFRKGGPLMVLQEAPAFVAVKLAALADGCATATIRADELTAQISDLRDRPEGRVVRAGDHPEKLRIELERALEEQKMLQRQRPIEADILGRCRAWLASLPPRAVLEQN
jgi:hypothetical protein